MMWTTEHEADIESDLSAFHRVDDPMELDGPRYFRLAERLAAYAGVLAARVAEEQRRSKNAPQVAARPSRAAQPAPPARRVVPESVLIAQAGSDWIGFKGGKG